MIKKDFLVPRANGTIARCRSYDDGAKVIIIDSEVAYVAKNILGQYNKSYKWATNFYEIIASILLPGGFISLIWFPWWIPILTTVVSYLIFKSTKLSCADFAYEIVSKSEINYAKFRELEIIVHDNVTRP